MQGLSGGVTELDLAEYFIDEQDEREWLPWGGLVKDGVVRNKDDSFFGVLAYDDLSKPVPPLVLPKGWTIWSEQQHLPAEDHFYCVVCWNPFWSTLGEEAENAISGRRVKRKYASGYFEEELSRIADEFRKADSSCRILEYQEVFDFLSFSLSFGENHVQMPEVPLYLDVLLTEGVGAEFEENSLSVMGKEVSIVSLTACPRDAILDTLRNGLFGIPYRYVRRLLAMEEEDAKADLNAYTKNWCGSRGYLKRSVLHGILSRMNGYYNEQIIFPLADETREKALPYVRKLLDDLCISYVFEKYNLKDTWWGSLAGCFRANIRPNVTGFPSLSDFLVQPQKKAGGAASV